MVADARLKNVGLRGVTVADTKISYIDGEKGVLIYRGYRIEDLAEESGFEETFYLLLNGSLPNRDDLASFDKQLRDARTLPGFIPESMKTWPRSAATMDVLQGAVPLLAMLDPELRKETRTANERKAARIAPRMAATLAAWHRIQQGLEPLPPESELSHAGNFLWQLTGKQPSAEMARALEVSMILQAEHTFNASTFACREVASTRAHLYASVAAGVGALSGSLHGGANAEVMKMLLEMEAAGLREEDVAAWVRGRLDRGEKIMGMGHAVYKTFDPRSKILRQLTQRLAVEANQARRYRLLERIEEECHKEFERRGKPTIKSNVDFYTGLLYSIMGIPLDAMPAMFAISLVAGWCSHIIEEKFAEAQDKPVLYRPQAQYIGDYCGPIGCEYRSLNER
jgi:citrate synthase